MLQGSMMFSAALVLIAATSTVQAADAAAGKVKMDAICSECHQTDDWKGKSEAELQGLIKDVVGGTLKHPKKLQLSDADIANIAAYLATAVK